MERRFAVYALVLLGGCNADLGDKAVPAPSDIERVEDKLSRHPCVSDLVQWERNYRFSRKTGLFTPYSLNPDLDVIEFHLRRVGTISIKPGRHVFEARPSGDWPDSGSIKSIDGKFTLSSGALSLSACEPIAGL